ncbi:phosphodiester glycosidase family protein [Legionella adelaidensis]|uniref:phosphodiester glycosidase family protein n=1 Tax=Legionella adelaidensis TaxID=45056 RepID=UPI001E5912E4|nr:phosphodiester glycosidase family protein [Legionella adelaidensis]
MIILIAIGLPALAKNWKTLAPGVEYKDINKNTLSPWSHIHVFRINLEKNELDLVMAKKLAKKYASAKDFSEHSKALITLNGGFFDQDHQPLGLRLSHHNQHNPIKNISWWGIFYIKNQQPSISNVTRFKADKSIDFALQSGPRLLIKGKIPSLKTGVAERSALGIDKEGNVIILVTEHFPMTTTALAELMHNQLHCEDALNLDGGSSSQLYAKIDSFHLHVPGFSEVSDAIIVKPKSQESTQ